MKPHPREQAVIRDILGKRALGWSLRKIIDHLDSRNVPPPIPERKGKPCAWHPQTVKEILERNTNAN